MYSSSSNSSPDEKKCDMEEKPEDKESILVKALSTQSLLSQSSKKTDFCAPNHAKTSLGKMETFYLNEELTDVVLIAGNKRIPAHRLVLSAASDYFAAMFTNDLREATQKEIELHDVNGDALWELIHYCYTGTVELVEDTVETLFGTARLLQLEEVVNACCSFLKEHLHPSNCIGIQLFADSQDCMDLFQACGNYIAEHFLDVVKNREFLVLSANEFAKLLASDDLNVFSEEDIFHALMCWLEHDLPNRKEDVSRLLSHVKLPLLPPHFIVDHIESVPLFQDNPKCRELITEAFKYQLLPERRSVFQSPRTFPRKSTIGSLYAIGGQGSSTKTARIEKYDARLNVWTCVATTNMCRLQFGVAVVGGKLIVVGGRGGLQTLSRADSYDMKSAEWKELPPMSTRRHGLGVAVLEGPLYAVGGHDGWSYLNSVERLDSQANEWRNVAPMQAQRSTLGVAALNGKLYAVGGRDGSVCLNSVECYNPHTDKWTLCASMTKRRGGVGVGVLNGYLYAVGGHDLARKERFECVERYDPKKDVWQVIASIRMGRDSVGVCVLGERLFAVGGHDGKDYFKMVDAYDPEKNEWDEIAPLNHARAGACVVALKN